MLEPVATIKEQFFDRPAVQKMVDRKSQKAIVKTLAFVRRTAQLSMKSRKGTAPIGSPPYAHEKSLKRLIFFAYSTQEKSGVAGPVKFGKYEQQEIPRTLEEGGVLDRITKKGVEHVTYGEHPYMKPALDENLPKVADLFRKS